MKLVNAFSLSMLGDIGQGFLRVTAISRREAVKLLDDGVESYIGHADTAELVRNDLYPLPADGGEDYQPVIVNRSSLTLKRGEDMVVAQYVGPRLPEGTKLLPQGSEIRYYRVSYLSEDTLILSPEQARQGVG